MDRCSSRDSSGLSAGTGGVSVNKGELAKEISNQLDLMVDGQPL